MPMSFKVSVTLNLKKIITTITYNNDVFVYMSLNLRSLKLLSVYFNFRHL